MPSPVDTIRRARAYLLRVAEPPAVALAALVADLGPVEAAAQVRAGTAPTPVLDETTARRHHDLADEDLTAADQTGARLVTPEDQEWPTTQITALTHAAGQGLRWATPPLALWVRGQARLADTLDQAYW